MHNQIISRSSIMLLIAICWMVGLVSCRSDPPTPTVLGGETPQSLATGEPRSSQYGGDSNVLLVADGQIDLQRENWDGFFPIFLGTIVHRGDTLRLTQGATASILCDDLTLWEVPAGGTQGVFNGCPPSDEPDIIRSGIRMDAARNVQSDIPYIVSPRRTNIMTAEPILRWHELDGTTNYKVQILGGDNNWSQIVQGSERQYPGQPPLHAGITYKLIVQADTRSSAEEGLPNLGFRLLTQDEIDEVEKLEVRLESLSLSEEEKALALAHIYASRTYEGWHLTADAINQIELLLQQGIESSALYQFKGDLFRDLELGDEAKQAYKAALELAEDADDIAGQAVAQAEIGRLYIDGLCEERLQVQEILELASENYQQLGDLARGEEVKSWIPRNLPQSCQTPMPDS